MVATHGGGQGSGAGPGRPWLLASLLLALGAGTAAGSPQSTGRAPRGPLAPGGPLREGTPPAAQASNVLILLADDIGTDMFPWYREGGRDLPTTPNLDRLVERGVLFRNCWAYAQCSPTRVAIQTGRHAFRTGVGRLINENDRVPYDLPASETTLAEMLRDGTGGAYRTAAIGKWHMSYAATGPNDQGWEHFAGSLYNFERPEDYYHWTKVVDGVPSTRDAYAPLDNVADALAWIDAQEKAPWVMYLAFNSAHLPLHRPPAGTYTTHIPGGQMILFDSQKRPAYKAMIEAMDTCIGLLLEGMAPEVLARTTVVFLADNGTGGTLLEVPPFDRDHGKGTLYDQGHVRQPGATSEALVEVTDLFATVAEIAGVDLARTLPGVALDSVSLVPYLSDPARPSVRDTIFAERFSVNGATGAAAFPESPDTGRLRVCQEDVGLAGPGALTLALCGAPLALGNALDLHLAGTAALAGQAGFLFTSSELEPVPWNGGTLLAPAPDQTPIVLDASGALTIAPFFRQDDQGATGAERLYVQAAVVDPAQPGGFALSNAIGMHFLMANQKAIRDGRFKLLTNLFGGEELYDLQKDPHERIDLLGAGHGALEPAQRLGYLRLRTALDALRAGL